MPALIDEMVMFDYLSDGGWILNRRGWWHPPSCSASWPIVEAYEMAKKDEAKGLRMNQEEVAEYLKGIR